MEKITLARILLLEQLPNFDAATQTVLEAAGYELLLAHDLVEAMKCIENEWPDLLLIDLATNRKSEILEFGKRLHRDPILRHLPLVFFASPEEYSSGTFEEEAHYAAAWLPKPCPPQILLRTLGNVLEQRK